jgi:hypothetical protein
LRQALRGNALVEAQVLRMGLVPEEMTMEMNMEMDLVKD